jgi:hypothetical protein
MRSAGMTTAVKVAVTMTLAIVIGVSLWESLVCWPAMIGCVQPWSAGWVKWAILYVGLLTGPFAPYYAAAVVGEDVPLGFLLGYTATGFLLFVSPYAYFLWGGKRSWGALFVGAALWLLAGHLFCIAIYV